MTPDEAKNHALPSSDANSDRKLLEALNELTEMRAFRAAAVESSATHIGSMCPSVEQWIRLAANEVDGDPRKELMRHAALCPACAALLRESLALLEVEALPAPPMDHRSLAARLAATPVKKQTDRRPYWMGAAAAVLLAASLGAVQWFHQQQDPARLLASAYSEQRLYALRVEGAGYGAMSTRTHMRGEASAPNASLAKARASLSAALKKSPDDVRLAELSARADLIDGKLDQAIAQLDALAQRAPLSAELLVDAATAHYAHSERMGDSDERALALKDLRRADELTPGDPVVLFNEALLLEACGQQMNAVETWTRFLQFEHDGQWIAEGRAHLNALEHVLNSSH